MNLREALDAAKRKKLDDHRRLTPTVTQRDKGPCPAVALAALTGWTYDVARNYLATHFGYSGRGLAHDLIDRSVQQATSRTLAPVHPCGTVSATVSDRFAGGKSGLVYCRGHVMPVVNGRLLNALGFEGRLCDRARVLT